MMQSDLQSLKNLGSTSINWLHAIGIHSYQELHAIGPIEAYVRIKLRGIRVSKVLLYALHGALLDIHWTQIDPALKQQLLQTAEDRLRELTPA